MSRPGDIVNDLRQAALICRERGMAITAQVIEDGANELHAALVTVDAHGADLQLPKVRLGYAGHLQALLATGAVRNRRRCAPMADDPEVTREEVGEVATVPFTIDHLLAHLQIEADFVVDRAVVTRGQRLVLRDMLQRAHDEIERLNDENEALRIDLAAAYCRMDDMEGLNDE